jgi:hypothetical protein
MKKLSLFLPFAEDWGGCGSGGLESAGDCASMILDTIASAELMFLLKAGDELVGYQKAYLGFIGKIEG